MSLSGLFKMFEVTKEHVLAALFDKGEGIIDECFKGSNTSGNDLQGLTYYRRELAGSPEKFFRVLRTG